MRQLTTRKTPSTRGGTQKRNHTARRKHIHAACTPPMATSINTTRVHRCRHPRKNQRHKGNVWARKARAAAQLLAAVRCLPEPSGRSRAAWRCRPGPGLPLPLPGALPAPGLRAPGGAAARSAGRVPFAASKAGNALGGHVGKTKPGAPSAPQLRSPRLEKSGGARRAPALSAVVPRTGRAAAAADAQRAKSRGSSRGLSRGSQPESRPRAETRPRGRDGGDPRSRYSVRWELCSWQRFLCRLKPGQR